MGWGYDGEDYGGDLANLDFYSNPDNRDDFDEYYIDDEVERINDFLEEFEEL